MISSLLKDKRLLVIVALIGAVIAAYGRGNALSFLGIAFYLLCAAVMLTKHKLTSYLLWFAVLFHAGLTVYSLWLWQTTGVIPCHYCMWAAGFALIAAVAWWRPPVVVLPLLLMLLGWYNWEPFFYGAYLEEFQTKETIQNLESEQSPTKEEPASTEAKPPEGASSETEINEKRASTEAKPSKAASSESEPPKTNKTQTPVDVPAVTSDTKKGTSTDQKTTAPIKKAETTKPPAEEKPAPEMTTPEKPVQPPDMASTNPLPEDAPKKPIQPDPDALVEEVPPKPSSG
ncbi:MAG: hypothetical protein ACOX2Q_05055 [Dehalobacterium sp.]